MTFNLCCGKFEMTSAVDLQLGTQDFGVRDAVGILVERQVGHLRRDAKMVIGTRAFDLDAAIRPQRNDCRQMV